VTVSSRDRVLLVILAVIGLVGGLYWFVVKPARADADARREELQLVQDQTGVLRDQLTRLQAAQKNAAKQGGEAFRLAKAVPDGAQTPGAIVQLQRLANRSNVDLSVVRTSSTTSMGTYQATQLEVNVTGRFFDVDDFMFRLHHQVTVDQRGTPDVDGRLFAVKSGQITLLDKSSGVSGGGADEVEAVLQVLVFSTATTAGTTAATAATTPAATTPAGATGATASAVPTSAVATAQGGVTTANAAQAASASSTGGNR
jgi:hypothetical protein